MKGEKSKGPSILNWLPSGIVLRTRLNAVSRILVATIKSFSAGVLAVEGSEYCPRHLSRADPLTRNLDTGPG